MNRASKGIRTLALTAAVLLLWCHGLDASFPGHTAGSSTAAVAAVGTAFAPATSAHPEVPQVNCCYGGASGNLLSVTLTKLPQVTTPLLAALLSALLLLATPKTARPTRRRPSAPRSSLVAQSILIRI